MGLPYTGCPSEAQALCHSKGQTKAILRGLGLPTAPFALVGEGEPVPDLEGPGPWIVKPDGEDASLGIDQASVVTDRAALLGGVDDLRAAYGGRVVVEAYLPGPEFNVGVLAPPGGRAAARSAEVVFDPPAGAWPILTYAAKWSAGSPEDRASPVRCPARIEPALAETARSPGRLRVPGDRLPRLCPGRPAARRPGRADDPGGQPQPRRRPRSRLGPRPPGLGARVRRHAGGADAAGVRSRSSPPDEPRFG